MGWGLGLGVCGWGFQLMGFGPCGVGTSEVFGVGTLYINIEELPWETLPSTHPIVLE